MQTARPGPARAIRLAAAPADRIRADGHGRGATLLAGTLYFVDLNAVVEGLRKIGYGAAILAGLLAIGRSSFAALRWYLVSRQTGAPLRLRDTTLGYLEATFINAFFPTLIASDGARVLRAIGSGANATHAFVGVVTDRIVALVRHWRSRPRPASFPAGRQQIRGCCGHGRNPARHSCAACSCST